MKSFLAIYVTMFFFFTVFATDQEADDIIVDGKKAFIQTSYEYPSIIEEYFISKKIPYPFEVMSSASYRGHVAEFEIKDGQLYLNSFNGGILEKKTKIETGNKIKIVTDYFFPKDKKPIFVSWYSGIILILVDLKRTPINCDEEDKEKKCHYFSYEKYIITEIKEGKILKRTELNENEFADCYKEFYKKLAVKQCNPNFYEYLNHIIGKKGFKHNMKGW